MSTRHEGAYVNKIYCVIRFCETCGHNKLCPYSWRFADIHFSLFTFHLFHHQLVACDESEQSVFQRVMLLGQWKQAVGL